jgi:putative addiction module component (TIGR02574 family)
MKNAIALPPAGFEQLSADQQIDYVQALWDRIAETQRKIPSPDWHRDVVRDRIAEHVADPVSGRSWAEISSELDQKFEK